MFTKRNVIDNSNYLVLQCHKFRQKCYIVEGDRGAGARENVGREGDGIRKTRKGGKRERKAFVIFLLFMILPKT